MCYLNYNSSFNLPFAVAFTFSSIISQNIILSVGRLLILPHGLRITKHSIRLRSVVCAGFHISVINDVVFGVGFLKYCIKCSVKFFSMQRFLKVIYNYAQNIVTFWLRYSTYPYFAKLYQRVVIRSIMT